MTHTDLEALSALNVHDAVADAIAAIRERRARIDFAREQLTTWSNTSGRFLVSGSSLVHAALDALASEFAPPTGGP